MYYVNYPVAVFASLGRPGPVWYPRDGVGFFWTTQTTISGTGSSRVRGLVNLLIPGMIVHSTSESHRTPTVQLVTTVITIEHPRDRSLYLVSPFYTLWHGLGSEQALAPVREPDTFAEGAWDNIRELGRIR